MSRSAMTRPPFCASGNVKSSGRSHLPHDSVCLLLPGRTQLVPGKPTQIFVNSDVRYRLALDGRQMVLNPGSGQVITSSKELRMASGPENHGPKDEEGLPLEEFQITAAEAASIARAFSFVTADR